MVRYLKSLKSSRLGRVQAFPMYGGLGMSAPSLHRESTDSMIISKTCIYIIKNEVGCRDDTVPKTVDARRYVRMTRTCLCRHTYEKLITAPTLHLLAFLGSSLCRDDADMPMPLYIRKAYNCPNAAFVSLFR